MGAARSLLPLSWEHINLTGDYLRRSSAKVGAGKFRPLRPLQRLNVLYFPFSEATPEGQLRRTWNSPVEWRLIMVFVI